MTDRALVIGLEHDNAAWELRAAVRDALAFADWVTKKDAGRATPETLTLLLAPHPDRPVTDRKFELATEPAIRRALFDHKKLDGATTSRLWFFYAGHGLAPTGGGPDEAPIVVPQGVVDLDFYRSNPIDLGSWIRELQVCAPAEQIFFVDACRGLVVNEDAVVATKTLFFDLSKVPPNAQAHQSVLFATTAGQLANEQQLHGLFSGALLQGLAGNGPELEPDVGTEEFLLTFSALVAYTKRRIQAKAEEVKRQHKTLPTQDPAESLFRSDGSMVLARLTEMPKSKVRVFVKPDEAVVGGTAGIRMFNPWSNKWERQEPRPKPLGVPVEWDLPASSHKIEIEAEGFQNWSQKITVTGPIELTARLVEKPAAANDNGGLESLNPRGIESSTAPPDGAELAAGKTGRLRVRARDRFARIEIFDGAGKRVAAKWEEFDAKLPVGAYRIEIALPTEPSIVRSVLLTADDDELVDDVQPDAQLTGRLPPGADVLNPHGGFTHPSEQFGAATTTHLGSLLAWAAWAAQYVVGDGVKLRAIGIDHLPPAPNRCFVRVLVGDARAPGPNPQGGPLETLVLDMPGTALPMKHVPGLAGFAQQCAAEIHGGSLTVSTGGLNPKRIPLPFVPDHVWTIIVVRESNQRTEIHRYLQRLQPRDHFDDTIRLIEQSWRAL
ncbi:MAG TPA: caspase family protein, partial [Nannocystaceae bacterium]|nr:caspase family protein [Nannocystaceae bacterium]